MTNKSIEGCFSVFTKHYENYVQTNKQTNSICIHPKSILTSMFLTNEKISNYAGIK